MTTEEHGVKQLFTFEVRTYDIWDDKEYPKKIIAATAGKAKYEYWQLMSDCWDIPFGKLLPLLRVRKLGPASPSAHFMDRENFDRMKVNRGIEFTYMGMRVEVNGKAGTITGYHGFNLMVLMDGDTRPGNCHPWWETKFFDKQGNVIRDYTEKEVASHA